jgi:hypothetical protein
MSTGVSDGECKGEAGDKSEGEDGSSICCRGIVGGFVAAGDIDLQSFLSGVNY